MALLVNELEYIYGAGTATPKKALKNVTLKIDDGEFIGLIGHTGSGKSTLIQHLNGLLKPTSGGVYYNGEDIHDRDFSLKKLRGKVGLVFQYPERQLFETTVIEDVKFGPKNIGMAPLDVDVSSFDALKRVGIDEELLDVSPLELSGGQKRRVALAGVLAMKPEVLILDEPTADLDPEGSAAILEMAAELHRERGITVILVSHNMEEIAEYAERLVVMNEGTIAFDGTVAEVFSHVRELEDMGLAVPQVAYVMQGLAERGVSLPLGIVKLEQAVDAVLQCRNKYGR